MFAIDRLTRAAWALELLWTCRPRDVPRLAALAYELADELPTLTIWNFIAVRGEA